MNAIQSKIIRVPLDAITLDDELQPRAKMDRPTWQEYGEVLANGGSLPPVLVVAEPGKLWLADGYHRLFAHRAAGADEIEAEVRRGTREDALRLSLAANAAHGKQRTRSDFNRGYDIAVRNGLVDSEDSVGVMELLRCSIRKAEELTEDARAAAVARRNAEIVAAKREGKSHREIAAEFDVSPQTVTNVLAVQFPQAAETGQEPEEEQLQSSFGSGGPAQDGEEETPPILAYLAKTATQLADEPVQDEVHEPVSVAVADAANEAARLRAGLADIASPEATMWHNALDALRAVNRLQSPEVLFANRYRRFDHVFGPELLAAHAFINDLHARFFNDAGQ